MATYFTVFFAQTNPATRERLAIGMTLVDPDSNTIITDYSRRKMRMVRELIGPEPTQSLKWSMEGLMAQTEEAIVKGIELTSEGELTPTSVFRKQYLQYLSRYLNNLLVADPVIDVDLPATQETFELLYRQRVDEKGCDADIPKPQKKRFQDIKKRPLIRNHFRIDVNIDQKIAPAVRFPIKVDLAGQNGHLTVAKLVATDRPARFINDDAHTFQSLLSQTPDAKHFLVSSEPNKTLAPKEHYLWENLREVFKKQYLDVSEFGQLEAYAEEHGVEPVGMLEEE